MSSRELENMMERASDLQLASTLGISLEELHQLDYETSTHKSDEGLIYEYIVHFQEYSPPEILEKIEGLSPTNNIHLQPHEMTSDPYDDELLWDIYSSRQLENLLANLKSAEQLLSTKCDGDTKFHLLVMLHAHIISAVEAFLSSTFIHTVTDSDALIRQFLATDSHFKDRKIPFSDLHETHHKIKTIVARNLKERIFHKLKSAEKLYRSVLNVEFGEIQWLQDAIKKRHDCVHRAGHDRAENRISIKVEDVTELIRCSAKFAETINRNMLIHKL